MNDKSPRKSSPGILALALAALAPIGVAHAGWTDAPGETGFSTPGYFSNFGSGKAPEMDLSMYDKVNLGSSTAAIWAPKPGAQGPIRDEHAEMEAARIRDVEGRLGQVHGPNTH
jgi:hypothetical protein